MPMKRDVARGQAACTVESMYKCELLGVLTGPAILLCAHVRPLMALARATMSKFV